MKKKLKLISSNKSVKEMVNEIESGTWEAIQKFNIKDFLKEIKPNEFAINENTTEQTRNNLIDYSFVARQVNKVKKTDDKSGQELGTVIFFPERFEFNGKLIANSNTYKLGNGNHGTLISAELNEFITPYNVVNFKIDLDGDYPKLRRLLNLLNQTFKERQSNSDDDLKLEWYVIMDDNISKGLPAKPTSEQIADFTEHFPQINIAILNNWSSNHKTAGGRRSPFKTYTQAELETQKTTFGDVAKYADYTVLTPTTIKSWNGEVLGRMINETTSKLSKKVLIILYASTEAQAQQLEDGKIQKKIEDGYTDICEHIGYDKISVIFLRHK